MHKRDIAHFDLKPENVLVTLDEPPVVRITDFSTALLVAPSIAAKVCPISSSHVSVIADRLEGPVEYALIFSTGDYCRQGIWGRRRQLRRWNYRILHVRSTGFLRL